MELENKMMTAARAFLDNGVPPDIIAKSMPSLSLGDIMALNAHKAL